MIITLKPVPEKFAKLELDFKADVCDRAKEIDESEEQDWFSLSLGWAIAKGLSPDDAHEFSLWVRYHRHYWSEL